MYRTLEYDYLFNKLSKNGVNYARLWLTDAEFNGLAVEMANFNISLDYNYSTIGGHPL